jgi:carbonic anhydrase
MSTGGRSGATSLISGVNKFQEQVFGAKESLFRQLGEGQSPGVLFITCSDSRINPNLLTQTEPGELFLLRNAGNLVPPRGSGPSGEAATVEYAVAHLKVRDVIVCGHAKCGAVAGLLNPGSLDGLPAVRSWLGYADGVVEATDRLAAADPAADRLEIAVERNVLKQLDNLRTHPAVADALAAGRLRLHGWVYQFETGAVTAHDPSAARFVPVAEARREKFAAPTDAPSDAPPADRSI